MSLYKRLHDVHAVPDAAAPGRDAGALELRKRVHQQLIEQIGPLLYDKRLSDEQIRRRVEEELRAALLRERAPLSAADKTLLIEAITADILGYGPIDSLLNDESVSDILVNGPDSVYVERSGRLEKTAVDFVDAAHLRRIIDKIVSQVGRRIDEAQPLCDARLPDGSRVNAVIHPLAVGGPYLTIRKFGTERLTIDDLVRFGTLDPLGARFLQACVLGRLNVVVAGGSGTGKTTTLNVLSSFIPADERIITVEDAKELQLHQDHVLALESRPPNIDGQGEITIRDLVKNTLRMRPDRIVVGECRSGEALDMLQAMNTGHDGSVTTVHANSPRDTLARIETLVLMSGFDLPVRAIREQMAAALDLVVQMHRLRDGSRRITAITEVQGMEGDVITLQDIFTFDHSAGVDDKGRVLGTLRPTGVRPKFAEKLEDHGIRLPADIFKTEKKAEDRALPSGEAPTEAADDTARTDGATTARTADTEDTADGGNGTDDAAPLVAGPAGSTGSSGGAGTGEDPRLAGALRRLRDTAEDAAAGRPSLTAPATTTTAPADAAPAPEHAPGEPGPAPEPAEPA